MPPATNGRKPMKTLQNHLPKIHGVCFVSLCYNLEKKLRSPKSLFKNVCFLRLRVAPLEFISELELVVEADISIKDFEVEL